MSAKRVRSSEKPRRRRGTRDGVKVLYVVTRGGSSRIRTVKGRGGSFVKRRRGSSFFDEESVPVGGRQG